MSQSTSVTGSSSTVTVFLSTFTPTLVMYLSEKMLLTKRETRLVLPTPVAPSMQTFFWIIAASLSGHVGRWQHAERHAPVAQFVRVENALAEWLAASDASCAQRRGDEPLRLEYRPNALRATETERIVRLRWTIGVRVTHDFEPDTPPGGSGKGVDLTHPTDVPLQHTVTAARQRSQAAGEQHR